MAAGGYFDDAVETREQDPDDVDDYDFEAPEVVVGSGRGASDLMERYFADLETRMRNAYEIARLCRERGLDPETRVEIPPAIDLAARVEELVGPRGVAARIRELSKEQNRELLSLTVAKECAAGKFGEFESKEKALDQAIRTGLAILTEGILVAPLEGIAGVRILQNDDGTDCAAVSFAGPIRAAGGTGQALSVLIADVVRRAIGIGKYIPTEREISRMKEEIPAYKTAASLQYTPSNEEIELIMRNCPVMIDGEGTEKDEIGGNRDLPRIETNQIRGGACLVLAEGMTLKAPKIQKHVKALNLEGWDFIDRFVNKGKKDDDGGEKKPSVDLTALENPAFTDEKVIGRVPIEPIAKFMNELIAGRPVFSHPSARGGWRLRYGRARTGGLATTALHPAAMALADDFLAPGTQMKIERPGKATAVTPCDSIEPPVALLHNGSLVQVETYEQGRSLKGKIRSVIDLGEMLIPYGEFAENNKVLPQSPWCTEWWEQVAERDAKEVPTLTTAPEAFAFATRTKTPLHPHWNLFWHDITHDDIRALSRFVEANGEWRAEKLTLPRKALEEPLDPDAKPPRNTRSLKDVLIELGALHEATPDTVTLDRYAYPIIRGVGLDIEHDKMVRRVDPNDAALTEIKGTCPFVSRLARITIMPRALVRMGTRMGRPEKAAERKMSPPTHLLFPIGQAGGSQRLLADAIKAGRIEVEVGERQCPKCRNKMVHYLCPDCETHTETVRSEQRIEAHPIDLGGLVTRAMNRLGMDKLPEPVKAVQSLISRGKFPEPIEKGLLRAKYGMWTFKDATTRFDMININLTHFKPKEAHVTVAQLHELGYTHDWKGAPLERDDQVLELRVQDIIVSTSCMDYMLKASQYIDELLVKFYGYKSYYNCKRPDDLFGHLFVALAPHTSGGVLCRIVGHTRAQAHYGHPFFHASKRRNADGDEDCVMLLLDGLLNFSKSYLPSTRGGQMDAPLTLTMRLDPSEVDKEAHNVDLSDRYPLEFFEATMRHPGPKDVEKHIDMVSKRLGNPSQYEGFGFTHDTANIAEGPEMSAYKTIGSMMDKMEAQLELAIRLRAVDAPDVAARVIGSHFLPDLMGNLKAFSKQSMRCPKCNTKYRRIPVTGRCRKVLSSGQVCNNPNLTMTVHEGSVKKYLVVSKEICEKYGVNPYVKQRIEHIEDSIDSVFQNDRVKKAKLSDFF